MKSTRGKIIAGLCLAGMVVIMPESAKAQTSEVKEKPPMYSYISNWDIPRAQWPDMQKSFDSDLAAFQQAMSGGSIVAYGSDVNLVHRPDGETHDQWWSAMSMAGLINVLEGFYQNGRPARPVLSSATKHWDEIFVSRYYNWHSGSVKNGYTHVSFYKLKPDAPDDAVEMVSKNFVVPVLEKQLAAGVISEYEIDTEAIHTDAPGSFLIVYVTPNAEGLDKTQAAVEQTIKSNPMGVAGFGAMIDASGHRDELIRTNAAYK